MSIPKSVRDLLGHVWRPEAGYSAFESVFEGRRKADPSYYHVRNGAKVETDMDTFSHAEVAALVDDGAFGPFAETRADGVVINEHAQHALVDFLEETYGAWTKYQERLRAIAEAGNKRF